MSTSVSQGKFEKKNVEEKEEEPIIARTAEVPVATLSDDNTDLKSSKRHTDREPEEKKLHLQRLHKPQVARSLPDVIIFH